MNKPTKTNTKRQAIEKRSQGIPKEIQKEYFVIYIRVELQ